MNKLKGIITAIHSSGEISLVDLDIKGETLSSLLIDTPQSTPYLRLGEELLVLFKETEVSIGKALSGQISCRNRLRTTIRSIERSEILTKLMLDFNGFMIVSIITTRSSDALNLKVGDAVEGLIKSNEITLKKETR